MWQQGVWCCGVPDLERGHHLLVQKIMRQIQTTFENVYVRFVLAHTAHWRFYVYALYKFTSTLTLTCDIGGSNL